MQRVHAVSCLSSLPRSHTISHDIIPSHTISHARLRHSRHASSHQRQDGNHAVDPSLPSEPVTQCEGDSTQHEDEKADSGSQNVDAQGNVAAVESSLSQASQASKERTEEKSASPTRVQRQPALRWIQLTRLPLVLTLHLKRFRSAARTMEKISTHVAFPLAFDANPYCCSSRKVPSQLDDLAIGCEGSTFFDLFGVVEHAGSFQGGHYTAFARTSTNPNRWHHFSDVHVKEVSELEVLGAQAFLLFYAKRNAS